jgi:aspartate carbamoyltransferase regulatory subunit
VWMDVKAIHVCIKTSSDMMKLVDCINAGCIPRLQSLHMELVSSCCLTHGQPLSNICIYCE